MQDGKCEPPTEYPGFGRFGCIPDCGQYTKTTTLTIDLQTFLHSSKTNGLGWDLSNVTLLNSPNFTFNIYSDTMGDFLFANDMRPDQKVMVEVPDGNLTLYLYQTAEMSGVIDFQMIYEQLGVLDATLPPRSATTDFAYGDPRELLAASTVVMDAIATYCWVGIGAPDPTCFVTPTQDIMLHVVGSYGLSGTVTMSDGMRGRATLVALPFCSAVPNRTAGLRDPANKAAVLNSSAPCPGRRALPRDSSARRAALPAPDPGAAELRRGGRRAVADPGCWNSFNFVTGAPDCTAGMDAGCPAYWYQVCDLKLPPYMALQVPCGNHSDCEGAFAAPLCGSGGFCVPCAWCQVDADDAIDGHCPQDACPGSGGWPRCVSGAALTAGVDAESCPAQVPFSVWAYHSPGAAVDVQPADAAPPVRTVTPSNVLVGSVALTQRRRRTGPCGQHSASSVGGFFNATPCGLGAGDGRPYGKDPTFLPSSAIYNGKLVMSDYYNASEIVPAAASAAAGVNVTSRATALGFFPYQYGRAPGAARPGDVDAFRLYFDGRVTASQAAGMVTYLSDGGFIDDQTRSVAVEWVTFNPSLGEPPPPPSARAPFFP